MATAAQLYGSVVAPNICVFRSTGPLRFSPLPPPSTVSSPSRNSPLLASSKRVSTGNGSYWISDTEKPRGLALKHSPEGYYIWPWYNQPQGLERRQI